MKIQQFITELKRRNVFRVATAYAVSAWLIIQIVATTFPYLNLPDWLITAVIILFIVGFPIAIVVAWVFELTSEGIQKSDDVEITDSVTAATSKKLNRIIISVLSIALVFLLTERIFFAESTLIENNDVEFASVAVLPFVNMSEDENNEYFSDGLSEELLNVLAKVDDLNVAGRTSSFKFKGQNENLSLIGEELKVNHIIEGSVRKSGNRIRITAQLVKVDDGYHVWSETYDRELTTENIFDIQDEISNAVLGELKVRLLGEEVITTIEYTQDIEAYNLYLAATQLEKNRDIDELEAALKNYKAAIRLDPGFALAYARLAWVYYLVHEYGNLSLDELLPLMRENIDKAYAIDPNLGKAVLAEAVYYRYTREPEKGLQASDRAIELIPNDPETWIVRRNAIFFSSIGDRNREDWIAMGEATKRAYELDENNPAYANMYARNLPERGEHEEALEILNRINRLYPEFGPAFATKARIYSYPPYGELDKAFITVFEQYRNDPEDLTNLTSMLDAAMNIDFRGMEDFLVQQIQLLYPGNPNVMPPIAEYYTKNERVTELLDQLGTMKDNGVLVPNAFVDGLTAVKAFKDDDYETAYHLFTKDDPDLKNGTFEASDKSLRDLFGYGYLNEKLGNDSIAVAMEKVVCEQVELRRTDQETEIDKVQLNLYCEMARGNFAQAIELMNTLYFEHKFKYKMLVDLEFSPIMLVLQKDPGFSEFENSIREDVWKMREHVIAYLKEEGEWREEWKVEMN